MKSAYIAVFVLFVCAYVLFLGVHKPFIPDETRYAEIPREMLASGDWVVPHLNGLRYFEKPVMGYWSEMISLKLFGENMFAARLPSALSTGAASLIVLLMLRKFGADKRASVLAAAVFLTCLEVFAVGVFNVLDAGFSLCITGTMAAFFCACMESDNRRRAFFLVLSGISCGFAFLTKGFLAFAIPAIAIAPFLIWERQWKKLFTMPWLLLSAAAVVALPWSLMIWFRDPDFWRYFFWIEHVQRFFASSDKCQHPEAWWFMIPVLLLGAIPWTFLFPAAISGLRNDKSSSRSVVRYCVCWFGMPFVLFSASHGKLGTYILPCFPPLAILVSLGLVSYLGSGGRRAFNAGAICSALLGFALVIALVVSRLGLCEKLRIYDADESGKWIVAIIVGAAWCVSAFMALGTLNPGVKVALYSAAPVFLLVAAAWLIPRSADFDRAPGDLLASQRNLIGPQTIIVSDARVSPAVCWHYKRNDVYLLESRGELEYGLANDETGHRLLTFADFESLIEAAPEKGHIVAITDTGTYADWKSHLQLPQPLSERTADGFAFVRY